MLRATPYKTLTAQECCFRHTIYVNSCDPLAAPMWWALALLSPLFTWAEREGCLVWPACFLPVKGKGRAHLCEDVVGEGTDIFRGTSLEKQHKYLE